MVLLSKFDFSGKELGKFELPDAFFTEGREQSVKDYLVAIQANKRQWSACTRGRSEVSHSTKKPFRQKGTGMPVRVAWQLLNSEEEGLFSVLSQNLISIFVSTKKREERLFGCFWLKKFKQAS